LVQLSIQLATPAFSSPAFQSPRPDDLLTIAQTPQFTVCSYACAAHRWPLQSITIT